MTASSVAGPPVSSTRGIRWGGLKGCPKRNRDGSRNPAAIASQVRPEVELDTIAPGAKAGSKLKKAEDLGVEVVDEAGFLELTAD